jgi:hypothetical protein
MLDIKWNFTVGGEELGTIYSRDLCSKLVLLFILHIFSIDLGDYIKDDAASLPKLRAQFNNVSFNFLPNLLWWYRGIF